MSTSTDNRKIGDISPIFREILFLGMDKVIAWLVCRLFVDMLCHNLALEDKVCHCLIDDVLLMLIYVCANILT